MKIRIEVDESADEDEVIIRCRELDNNVAKIQHMIIEMNKQTNMTFYKNNVEYFLPLDNILFFETSDNGIDAHTKDDVFAVRKKLYELEEILPENFVRVSKSTILNVDKIYSIEKNITSSSMIAFENTYKQVYASRGYYKNMKQRLDERRKRR